MKTAISSRALATRRPRPTAGCPVSPRRTGPSLPSDYSSPFAIAVNQATHDLYVIDAHHEVVDVFDEDGVYLRQITDTPTGLYRSGGENAIAIAVSAKSGAVYVGDSSGPNLVFEFDSTGNYVETWDGSNTPDGRFSGDCEGCGRMSLAVEDSTGNVMVSTSWYRAINIFQEDGAYISQISYADYPSSFLLGLMYGIAIDQATGDIYESDWNKAQVFKPVVVPDVTIDPPSEVTARTVTFTGSSRSGRGW